MPHSLRKRIVSLIAAVVLFVPGYAGCEGIGHAESGAPVFSSVSEIPGVTEADLAAVRELRDKNESFVYAVNYSTEAFCEQDGTVNGFTALFCEWLSQLFEIPFIPRIVEWDELIDGLENGSIDFTGELTANEERRKKYLMTDDIVQRRIIYIRTDKSLSLQEIANRRDLRYGFLVGATTIEDVRLHEKKSFEEFFADDHREAYEMLLNGTIDAFFEESTAEAAFDFFGEVEVGTFFPIIYSPVSLTTQNQELKIIIDIFQKALDNGAINYLTEIYNRGHFEYTRQKFRLLLTDEERDYIAKNPVINYGAEIANYPVSFFNDRTRKFEGIAHDVINELEKLTGLVFLRANDELTHWPELLQMLDDGEVAMITELIPSEDRIGNYRWAGVSFFQSHLILISKTEHHDIEANEILYVKTGLSKNTGHSILFKQWFPNHRAIVEYPNTTEALNALERGEVDMVMTSEHQLLIMTNYRELVGYKANFVFEYYFDSTFGFGYEEENLSAIMTKAMRLVDINGISGRWMRRTYDYRVQLAQDRILFVIAGGALLLGFLFMFMQLIRKRKEGKKLESLVEKRTKELSENQNRLQDSLRHNEYQLLKLNLMVKATKIGLWDMYIKRDDPVNPSNEIAWSDEFRKMLGYKNEIDFPNIFGSLITRLHPADVSKIIASFVEHINDAAANAPYDVEYRAQRKNGEYGYFRA
ncbi:MAG: transporter substrate-binding domain-containing protein, partial [Defluviitaleaceae bacterium]|nr:transporter substrate-binding domain-containing protein [Defluviitaleaceae bacterium]